MDKLYFFNTPPEMEEEDLRRFLRNKGTVYGNFFFIN